MLRLIHVINFAITRLNEAERMVEEKDLIACFNFTDTLNNEHKRYFYDGAKAITSFLNTLS